MRKLKPVGGVGHLSRKGERGQNLAEFALVLPVLLLFVCSIIEFGNMLRVRIEIQNSTREGARYAADNYGDSSLQSHVSAKVQGSASAAPDISGMTVTVTYPTACPSVNAEVTVSTSYNYPPITPVGGIGGIGGMFGLFGSAFNPAAMTFSSTLHSEC